MKLTKEQIEVIVEWINENIQLHDHDAVAKFLCDFSNDKDEKPNWDDCIACVNNNLNTNQKKDELIDDKNRRIVHLERKVENQKKEIKELKEEIKKSNIEIKINEGGYEFNINEYLIRPFEKNNQEQVLKTQIEFLKTDIERLKEFTGLDQLT